MITVETATKSILKLILLLELKDKDNKKGD
jgi:hypothetical protein